MPAVDSWWLPALRPLSVLGALGLVACNSGPRVLTLELTVGHETEAMTEAPAVTRVDIEATTLEGETYTASAGPGEAFDLGDVPVDAGFLFEITGVESGGATVMRGRSLSNISPDTLDGDVLPLFIQRTDQWARPPNEMPEAIVRGPATTLGEAYLVAAGGDTKAKTLSAYDLLTWGGAVGDAWPFSPQTLVTQGNRILGIGAEGARWMSSDGLQEPTLPDGLASFAEVAGGAAVLGPEGQTYVVGGARTTTPTDAVLEIALDGTLRVYRLLAPRAGAATTWLADVGLVVAGGSDVAPGVEVLGESATAFSSRDFPPDPARGAAAFPTQSGVVGLAGGQVEGAAVPTRTIDPRCTSDCDAVEIAEAAIGHALDRTSAFANGAAAYVIGDDAITGETRAFLLNVGFMPSASETIFKERRFGATAAATPNGLLAIVGGVHDDDTPATTIETWFP